MAKKKKKKKRSQVFKKGIFFHCVFVIKKNYRKILVNHLLHSKKLCGETINNCFSLDLGAFSLFT